MDKEFLEQKLKEGKTYRQIAEECGKSKSTISYWCKKYNLSSVYSQNKPQYKDEKMFNKIDTKEKAYIIGYTLADGYINNKCVSFKCALKDKEIIDFIQKNIGGKTYVDEKCNPGLRRFPSTGLNCYNKNIVTDFNKHCSQKLEKHCPIISKDLNRFLVQGFFDGDGCLTWGRRKDRNRIWHKISFTSSLKVLEGIQQILLKDCDISTVIRPKAKEKCFVLEFASKKNVLKFLKYIYPNDDFIILNRKFIKAQALRLELGEFGEDPLTPSEAI